jgi:hypothetical protein
VPGRAGSVATAPGLVIGYPQGYAPFLGHHPQHGQQMTIPISGYADRQRILCENRPGIDPFTSLLGYALRSKPRRPTCCSPTTRNPADPLSNLFPRCVSRRRCHAAASSVYRRDTLPDSSTVDPANTSHVDSEWRDGAVQKWGCNNTRTGIRHSRQCTTRPSRGIITASTIFGRPECLSTLA